MLYQLAEINITWCIIILLLYGVIEEKRQGFLITVYDLIIASWFIIILSSLIKFDLLSFPSTTLFNGLLSFSYSSTIIQLILLSFSALVLLIQSPKSFESILFFLFTILGLLWLIAAHDLISLYLAIELQSFSLYLLAATDKDSSLSTEAALKYFLLGGLSSGLLLFGSSILYGITGSTSFDQIYLIVDSNDYLAPVAIIFILAALLFKVGAAPFHMWLPDVYHGVPTFITTLFAVLPKIAVLTVILNLIILPLAPLQSVWLSFFIISSILSMIIGAFGALNQSILKRLFAYSAIGHIGYIFISFATLDIYALFLYVIVYMIMTLNSFSFLLALEPTKTSLADLVGLSRSQPILTFTFILTLLSLAGIPPLAGFLSKYIVFLSALHSNFYLLAIIGILTSVIAALYYVRLIQLIYFYPKPSLVLKLLGDLLYPISHISLTLALFLGASSLLIVFLFWFPTPFLLFIQHLSLLFIA